MGKALRNPIEEYIHSSDEKGGQSHKELFNAEGDAVRTRTELDEREIRLLLRLIKIDMSLKDMGLEPIYSDVTNTFMELQISKNRQSRAEYVQVNKSSREDELQQQMQRLMTGQG